MIFIRKISNTNLVRSVLTLCILLLNCFFLGISTELKGKVSFFFVILYKVLIFYRYLEAIFETMGKYFLCFSSYC